ncbi:sensor histidine kinase [Algibacter pacificus]|uniref:sensor histidine kinase n=1 Tax=Algibacter pacificus TaxID=2599389 RepID=UPI0011C8C0BF|nr:HAMP domain-containing sensor histidine kinase [Algibacter pacificus]
MKKLLSLKKHEYILFILSFIITIIFISFSLNQLKSFSTKTIETSLVTANKSCHEALKQWLYSRKNNIKELSKNKFLVDKTIELLKLKKDSTSLTSSSITPQLRAFFQPILSAKEDLGVFLIDPNYISIFSMRNANTGTVNLMAKESKLLLDKVLLKGETVLIPPIKSDVALNSKYSNGAWHTMFLVTPIIHEGTIIAAFSLRLDTKKDFSRILELGKIGETGETYGVNSIGRIVTSSHFNALLKESENLNAKNLNKSLKILNTSNDTDNSIICNGHTLNKTIDISGQDIFKICIWDKELNIQVTTQIDKDEALKGYYFIQKTLITIMLFLFGMGFILINIIINLRQKTENILIESKRELELTVIERTKELKHSVDTKDKFFSILAHDLKSPFSGLLGLLNILLQDSKAFSEEKKAAMLQEIYNSSSQLYKLLENLLSWSRSQTNSIKLNPQPISIWELINENINLQQQNANRKEIELVNNISKDIVVKADRNTIDTVFRNLISNAIKFTNKGGTVKIKQSIKNKRIEIIVEDNGIGIPKKNIEKLFKIEEKLMTTGTNNEKGTGLGLVLCKEFVELNGGNISLKKNCAIGASFIVELPKLSKIKPSN